MEMSGLPHAPSALSSQGNLSKSQHPSNVRMFKDQERSGRFVEKLNLLLPSFALRHPAHNLRRYITFAIPSPTFTPPHPLPYWNNLAASYPDSFSSSQFQSYPPGYSPYRPSAQGFRQLLSNAFPATFYPTRHHKKWFSPEPVHHSSIDNIGAASYEFGDENGCRIGVILKCVFFFKKKCVSYVCLSFYVIVTGD